MKRLFLSAFLLSNLFCFSQVAENTDLRANIKAPDVSDFIKQGNIPIGHYTGSVNLNLPVLKSSAVDISLSYESSGFRPMKRPSSVGLNWSLNTGGAVTREVVGTPDEYIGYPHSNGNARPYNGFIVGVRNRTHNYIDAFNHSPNAGAWLLSHEWNLFGTDITKAYEGSPDIFRFNVNGFSGKFFMGNDGNVKVVTNQPGQAKVLLDEFPNQDTIDCTPVASKIKIIDANGNIYHFGGATSNLGYTVSTSGVYKPLINTWYLSKIEYTSGRELNYTYQDDSELTNYFCSMSSQGYKLFLHNPHLKKFVSLHEYVSKQVSLQQSYGSFSGTGSIGGSGGTSHTYEMQKKAILDKIEYDDSRIQFTYSDQAHKFNKTTYVPSMGNYNYHDLKLDNIKYYTDTNALVKTINFNYEYLGGANNRMFLSSYGEVGLPEYNFEYNLTSSDQLPIPETRGIDHWSYWNGNSATGNQLVPSMNYQLSGDFSYTNDTRAANFSYANKGQLTKVIYPTKGYSVFEFEPHNYSKRLEIRSAHNFVPHLYDVNDIAGGTRVKKITDYDHNNQIAGSKEYKYLKNYNAGASSGSSGVLLSWPRYVSYWAQLASNGFTLNKYGYIRSSTIGKNTFDSNSITYSEVIEIQNNNGYIVSKFSDFESNPDINDTAFVEVTLTTNTGGAPYTMGNLQPEGVAKNYIGYYLNSREVERGKLISNKIYDNANVLKKEEINTYDTSADRFNTFTSTLHQSSKWSQSNKLYYYPYFLSKSEVTTYDLAGNNPFKEEVSYMYNNRHLPYLQSKGNSTVGDKIEKQTYYPDDVLNINSLNGDPLTSQEYSVINKLKTADKHRIATPIQIESYKKKADGSRVILSKQRNLFKEEDGLIVPSKVQSIKGTGVLEDKVNYKNFDHKGNLLEYTKIDGDKTTVYIWGHNNTVPIAKIENTTHQEIETALNMTEAQVININAGNMSLLNGLRNSLPNAMVSTYTYKALVGITSITDPRGNITYYEYDSLNRLKYIKDKDGNILSVNKYNYKQ